MADRFRLALVGAGMIARQCHLPAVLASGKADLVAVVDPDYHRAAELANAFGIRPKIAQQVLDVLGEIDGAVIATPNNTHAQIAITCLEAGVSTLIEKPLAATFAEGMSIVRVAESAADPNGTVAAVGYSTRFRQSTLLLKDLLNATYFGTVRRFVHQFGTRGGWTPMSSYNLSQEATGGGVLVVTGSHFLDRMLYFWGYPDEIEFWDDSKGGLEANCMARFRFTNSERPFEGTVLYSKTIALRGGLVIETDKGVVTVAETDDADIIFRPREAPEVEQVIQRRDKLANADNVPIFQRQLENFVDACRLRRLPLVDCRQALASLKLIEDLYSGRKPIDTNWFNPTGARTLS
jgi:predicted dehydrogenase